MIYLGAHLSAAGGFYKMGQTALRIGADTFQCFLRNPRGAKAKAADPADIERLRVLLEEEHFGPFVAHAPYTMNPCSATESVRELAREMMAGDLELMERLPGNYYNFHPGSHVGQGAEAGCAMIAQALNAVIRPQQSTMVLLETMAGKGSEIGGRFQELRDIIDRLDTPEKVGVCLDTCHVSDSGYDIRDHLTEVLDEFDQILGLDRLKAVHLNDSMNPMGARKDRHALIGEGYLGLDAVVEILREPRLQGLPFVLETPTDDAGHGEEIRRLRELTAEPS